MKGIDLTGFGRYGKRQRLLSAASAGALLVLGLGGFALATANPSHTSPANGAPQHSAAPAHAPAPAHAAPVHAAPAPQARPAPVHAVARTAATPRLLENGAPFSFADLVERVSPAVVTVTVEQQMKPQNFIVEELPEPFRDFFNQFGGGNGGRRGFSMPRKAVAMGSGFVIDRSGLIVTNNHVVEDGKKITAKFPDGRE